MGIYKAIPRLYRCFWLNSNYIEESWTKQVGTSGNASDLYLGGAQFKSWPGQYLDQGFHGFPWYLPAYAQMVP